MTREEKDLLLKDLCARLPYGVVIQITSDGGMVEASYDMRLDAGLLGDLLHSEDDFKPYLRPMSSMTKEEKNYYEDRWFEGYHARGGDDMVSEPEIPDYIDWLHYHHFDYRGLIDKGLAIAVNENNNPYID